MTKKLLKRLILGVQSHRPSFVGTLYCTTATLAHCCKDDAAQWHSRDAACDRKS